MRKQRVLEWERRWRVPVALAALGAVVFLIASTVTGHAVSGEGAAEITRSVEQHKSSVALSSAFQALGFLLLVAPLFYLFRAARARSERVRPQMVGLVLVAPLFLAVASGLSIGARTEAADQFVAGEAKLKLTPKEAKEQCESDRQEEGAKEFREENEPKKGESAQAACERRKKEDDRAENAGSEASLAPIVQGMIIAGTLGLIVAFFYTSLSAMRTGLLPRFWGALGIGSGIALVLGPLSVITLAWLIYLALMLFGKVPGGRPPAWEAGEAIPWPTPGEQAATELEPSEPLEGEEAPGEGAEMPEERRKRKQRD